MSKYVKIGYTITESWNIEGTGQTSTNNPYSVDWYSGPDGKSIYESLAASASSTGEDQYGLYAFANSASYTNRIYHYIEPAGYPDKDETYGYDIPRCRCSSKIGFYIGVNKNGGKISAKVKSFIATQNTYSGFNQPYVYYTSLAKGLRYFPYESPLNAELHNSFKYSNYWKDLKDGVNLVHRKTTPNNYKLDEYDGNGFSLSTSYSYKIVIELADQIANKLTEAVPDAEIIDIKDIMVIDDDNGGPKHILVPDLYASINPYKDWMMDDTSVPTRILFPETNESESHIDYTDKWVITDDIPYRLDFPSLKASRDAKHDWHIDDDIPFQGGFPELHESEKFDFHDKWVADKEVEDTGDLVFLKLTIPFTVTVASGSDSFTLSTPFDNRKINYFDSRKNYGTRDCQLSIKLPYNVPIYQMDFTQSNDIVASVGSAGLYLFPRSDTPTTGRCTYQNTNYASESHVASYKNTELVEPEYNSYYDSYLCVGEFDCRTVQNDHKSGTTEFTYGFIFAFHSNIPTDMDKYDRMLEYYDGYIEPFHYTRSSVPYRLDFPSLNESIPGTDIWVIDDDIPYRLEFPTLHESNGGYVGWLQNTGYDPYRPWPNHKTIFQSVHPVTVPEVDWTRSMSQTFEYFEVDPKSWNDAKQITTVISSNINRDSDSEMKGSSSMELSEPIDESYIRTYLKVKQDGFTHRFCLGTFLYMMSSDNYNGLKHQYTMTGYTPLIELREKLPPLGYNITGVTGEINGKVAPMVTDEVSRIVSQYTRLKLDNRVRIEKPLLNNYVANTSDTLLNVVASVLNASSLQEYSLTVDERGAICIKEAVNVYNERHAFEFTDDNSSILLPSLDLSLDLSSIPNVLEVIYAGDANKDIGAVRVVVRNEDPNSIVSTVTRGREIWARTTIRNIGTYSTKSEVTKASITEQVTAQAYRLLEAASTIRKTIQYSHGYCNVKVGDTVLFNYKRAGLVGVKAKVVSQTIQCKPGCQVDETAVYTKKLWNRIRN